jgi:hypothetical protein
VKGKEDKVKVLGLLKGKVMGGMRTRLAVWSWTAWFNLFFHS